MTRVGTSARKAAMSIWFMLVIIPMFLFALILTIDTAVALEHYNAASTLANDSALAGVQLAADPRNLVIDESEAFLSAQNHLGQVVSNSAFVDGKGSLDSYTIATTPNSVTVTLEFTIPDPVFSNSLLTLFNASRLTGETFTVTRTSFLCIPGDSLNPTAGACARPTLG